MMPTTIVDEFRGFLAERFGWRLEDDRGQISQVLVSRLLTGRPADQYLASLRRASSSAAELRAIVEALAVSETYFFRNPDQFAALGEIALPTAAARRPAGPLRILSAGAASGEEAYSIAMTVHRMRARVALPPIEILGVDVSRRAIERARRGRYSAWALRGLPADLRRGFFVTDGRHFDVRAEVASMVRFEERNLLDLHTATPGPWDIVFCRNTLMYFTPRAARDVLAHLAAAIVPGGFLFLGHAETLRGISDAFALEHTHETFYYRRVPAGDRAAAVPTEPRSAVPIETASAPPSDPADDEWFHAIARATQRVAALVDGRAAPGAAAATQPATPAPLRGMSEALELLRQERYEEALAALDGGTAPECELVRSVLLAQTGRIAEATAACNAVLVADSMHAGAHYVLALCAERSGDDAGAARHDEMAIYLDDTFAMPHLHLSLLRRRRGDRAAALRHARRARHLFADEDELRILLFGNGFTRKAMVQLCEAQLQSLAS
jgi:chemotaxis protein methyltransferase CheR